MHRTSCYFLLFTFLFLTAVSAVPGTSSSAGRVLSGVSDDFGKSLAAHVTRQLVAGSAKSSELFSDPKKSRRDWNDHHTAWSRQSTGIDPLGIFETIGTARRNFGYDSKHQTIVDAQRIGMSRIIRGDLGFKKRAATDEEKTRMALELLNLGRSLDGDQLEEEINDLEISYRAAATPAIKRHLQFSALLMLKGKGLRPQRPRWYLDDVGSSEQFLEKLKAYDHLLPVVTLTDDYDSAGRALKLLIPGADEKTLGLLNDCFFLVSHNQQTQSANVVWRFMAALMMTEDPDLEALHDQIMRSWYNGDSTLLKQMGHNWAGKEKMNEADNLVLYSRFYLEESRKLPKFYFADKATFEKWQGSRRLINTADLLSKWQKDQSFMGGQKEELWLKTRNLENFPDRAENVKQNFAYWINLFGDDDSNMRGYIFGHKNTLMPGTSRPSLLFSLEFLRKVGQGDRSAIERLYAEFNSAYPIVETRNFNGKNLVTLFGPQKSGKTMLNKLFRRLNHVQEQFWRDIVKEETALHLDHTVDIHFDPKWVSGDHTHKNWVDYVGFIVDCMGLESGTVQGSSESAAGKTYPTDNDFFMDLCEQAREWEAFQTTFEKGIRGASPIIVVEQYDDAAKAMIDREFSDYGTIQVLHNLRFSTPEEVDQYTKTFEEKGGSRIERNRDSGKSPRWIERRGDNRMAFHYIIGDLKTKDPVAFKRYINTIVWMDQIHSVASTSLDEVVEAATNATNRVYGGSNHMDLRSNASEGIPFITSKTDTGATRFTLAFSRINGKPTILFGHDYKNDLTCTVIFNNGVDDKVEMENFTFRLTPELKGKVTSLVDYFKDKKGVQVNNGTIEITLPNHEDPLLVESVKSAGKPFSMEDWEKGFAKIAAPSEPVVRFGMDFKNVDELAQGISMIGKIPEGKDVTTVAFEGDYNAGKSYVISEVLDIEKGKDVGDTVHTEGLQYFFTELAGRQINVVDKMGGKSGILQTTGADVTDEDIRKKGNAITRGGEKTDLTIFVANAFTNDTRMKVVASPDPTRLVILHNMKKFLDEKTTDLYMARMEKFLASTVDRVEEKGFAMKIKTEDGYLVIRQPNGVTHLFMKNSNLASAPAFNERTIQLLRSAIVKTKPRTTRTHTQSIDNMVEGMIRGAFAVPDGASVEVKRENAKLKPVIKKGLTEIKSAELPQITPRQDTYATGGTDRQTFGSHLRSYRNSNMISMMVRIDAPFIGLANKDSIKVTPQSRGISFHYADIEYTIPARNIISLTNLPGDFSARLEGSVIKVTGKQYFYDTDYASHFHTYGKPPTCAFDKTTKETYLDKDGTTQDYTYLDSAGKKQPYFMFDAATPDLHAKEWNRDFSFKEEASEIGVHDHYIVAVTPPTAICSASDYAPSPYKERVKKKMAIAVQ